MSICSFSQNWQLVWSDEFTNGISGDWVFETGGGGWGNNELEYYRRENASVQNGQLVLTAKRENYGGYNYTSVRMKTQGRKSWKYGKIEARIAMPSFSGAWPAFWMLGDNISSVGWPSCGEIDIMEHINTGNTDYGTIHWNNGGHVEYSRNTQVNNITAYHTYTITWDANSINWLVDGVQYSSANIANNVNNTAAFHNNFFILLNFAIGGAWPGYNIDNNAFPANMYVDYVRVYQDMGGNTGGGGGGGGGGVATVYKDCNYGGYAVGLPAGNYNLSDLTARGISNDDISSIKVSSGYEVQLFWDANFAGSSTVISGDNSCLVGNGWNDQASSLVVRTKTNTGGGGGGGGTGSIIQAENYSNMSGVQKEACTDAGGGQDVGWIDAGDWMAYNNINIPSTGTYTLQYRVASPSGGQLSSDLNAGAIQLGSVNVPATGGWQNWTTVSKTVNLNAGTYNFGIYAQTGGYNINWFSITPQSVVSSTTIQAESFSSMSGVQTEACSDAGGGSDVGYIDAGDWMAYNNINFPVSGNYTIQYRVASQNGGGSISSDLNAGSIKLGTLGVPSTGGWQNWTTISQNVYVNAGTYNFGIYAAGGGWNLNWIKITQGNAKMGSSSDDSYAQSFDIYPIPVGNTLNIQSSNDLTDGNILIIDAVGTEVMNSTFASSIDVSSLQPGVYILRFTKDGNTITKRFIK